MTKFLTRFLTWALLKLEPESPTPLPSTQPGEVRRLGRAEYLQLESKLPKLGTPRNSEEACTLVGIQLVLAELRKGFVVGEV